MTWSDKETVFGCRRCGASFKGTKEQLIKTATCNCSGDNIAGVWVEVPPFRPGIDEPYQTPVEMPEN